jgi:Calcineurin-like phosphoesterase/Iron/zinc purple acid phosphatase-like protein C
MLFLPILGCNNTPAEGLASGPMVQQVSSNAFSVVWYDRSPKTTKCQARAETGELFDVRSINADKFGRRVATFKGLAPDTKYTYRLGDGKEDSRSYTTRTAPAPSTDAPAKGFRILAFGDSGSGDAEQYKLAKEMLNHEPAVAVHTGDLIYPDGERSDYPAKFYDPYAKLIANVPFYPCPGNHDVRTERAAPMFEEFELPTNGPAGETPERNYWFDYGQVRFVAIDTNVYREKLKNIIAPWMEKVLSEPGPRWKICYFHHPVYSNGNYGPTRKLWNTIVPVMEKCGVQLVLSGHDHLFERTFPIRDRKIVKPGKGIVYITTGAGGAELYSEKSQPIPEIEASFDGSHSFTIIDVDANALKLKQIDIKGAVIDTYVIPHRDTIRASEPTDNEASKIAA